MGLEWERIAAAIARRKGTGMKRATACQKCLTSTLCGNETKC